MSNKPKKFRNPKKISSSSKMVQTNFIGKTDYKGREIIGQTAYNMGNHFHYVVHVVEAGNREEPFYVESWVNPNGTEDLEIVILVNNINHPWTQKLFHSCDNAQYMSTILMSSFAMSIQMIETMGPRINMSEEQVKEIIDLLHMNLLFTVSE